jgi:hypothetical protein
LRAIAMSRDATAIIADLNGYSGSATTWRGLDELAVELFRSPVGGAGLDALFGVFAVSIALSGMFPYRGAQPSIRRLDESQ